ncbi:MAG: DUF4848 domain-containing protein [Draconibacterium sp.]
MKKLVLCTMVAMALTIFNGCQKDELVLTDEQPQAVVKSDVYVENGYLAFKNMEAVDSVIQMLDKMTAKEVKEWENKLGFTSAKTYFDPIFKEAEQATTIESILAFKKKYQDVLKWNENDLTDYSFDYPFYFTNFVSLMNKNGILKIGKSIFKYNKDNRITIFDGDISKLAIALTGEESENIQIIGKKNTTKSSYAVVGLTNFAGQYGNDGSPEDDWCNWSSSRKMKTGLQFEDLVYLNYSGTYDGFYKIWLWQRAQKKVLGIWWNYSVRYRYGNMVYKENNVIKSSLSGSFTTPSTQSTQIEMYGAMVFMNLVTPPPIPIPSSMYFTCYTTNEDFSYYPFTVLYTN